MIEFFVPGQLRNPLNGSWGGWRKHARLAQQWREKTAAAVFAADRVRVFPRLSRVTFTGYVGRLWDDDNLPAAIKPVRDMVARLYLAGDDSPRSGHEFVYRQTVERGKRGVGVRIEPLGETPN